MTNLLATIVICIATNVAVTDNGIQVDWPNVYGGTITYGNGQPWPMQSTPATEKTETTEIVEVKTLRFEWEGEEYTAKRERVLSRKVRRLVKKENWVEE